MKSVTKVFLAGLVAVVPLAVLVGLAVAAEQGAARFVRRLFPHVVYWPGLGAAAVVAFVFAVGLVLRVWLVRFLFERFEAVLGRVPLVKTLYGSVRDLMGFFGPGAERPQHQVVLVTLADTGVKLVGLLTRDRFDDLPSALGGAGKVGVYLPMSYQLGGYFAVVDRSRVEPLDMTIEEAMRFVVTAGVTTKSA